MQATRHSIEAVHLISQSEGCRLTAYKDQAGVVTIGYGHTGTGAAMGATISPEDAELLLSEDLKVVDEAIGHLVQVPLTQSQYDATCSLIFNIGRGHFSKSSVLRCLNAKEYKLAADHFLDWRMAAGKINPGLVARRARERELFLR